MRCYPYRCNDCGRHWDVYKSLSAIDDPETCQCGKPDAERYIARTFIFGAKVEDAEYNPALGLITRNARHRADEAKARGMIEIGNEPLDSIHAKAEADRADRRKAIWDDDRIKAYD